MMTRKNQGRKRPTRGLASFLDIDAVTQTSEAAEVEAAEPPKDRTGLPAVNTSLGKGKSSTLLEKTLEAKDKTIQDLKRKLELNAERESELTVAFTMPVTKTAVDFKLVEIDPGLIDVSLENERIQKFLDPISLQDLLPSIRRSKQQKPGMIRPIANGRYELIEGSRRLACARLLERKYLAYVGDVPDADVREVSKIENVHSEVSLYEKAKAFQRRIENDEFQNWEQLGAAEGISRSHAFKLKRIAELNEVFLMCLRAPSDMTLEYADWLTSKLKASEANRKALINEAELIASERSEEYSLEVKDALARFKKVLRVKASPKQPTKKKSVVFYSKDKSRSIKYSISNSGSSKLEFVGVERSQVDDVIKSAAKILGVEVD